MNNNEIYQQIADNILEAMESATGKDWESPFAHIADTYPTNGTTGAAYRGVNVLNLWACGVNSGFGSGEWATFKQWRDAGWSVQKGQKSVARVIFFKILEKEKDGITQKIPLLKSSAVFNRDQTCAPKIDHIADGDAAGPCEVFAEWMNSRGADIRTISEPRAYYHRAQDFIAIGPIKTRGAYHATVAHELAHWTGHKSRLNRSNLGYAASI